eukprot:gnl/Dysnectes_brevis/3578_a4550_309.p1 GENE.gnl/Dysnectes_brevis/3578_a4550_309~~gnl/Dysnectes_brevis/3578_a4550_309.p1  ORF type:complete len:243 (+),score=78.21 gnl/Dysnectes_brevis/3578_a4550_309:688-1416(+)
MIFLILTALLVPQVLSLFTCPSQRQALINMYNSCGGQAWNQTGWLSNTHECNWSNLECNSAHQLTIIDLSEVGMLGQLPPDIGCFPHLKTLNLGSNRMRSTIPDTLCDMRALKYVTLDDAGIYGGIPQCLGMVESLQYLYADNNALDGELPPSFSQLVNIKELHFACNRLEGSLPPGVAEIPSLMELHLQCNPGLSCPLVPDSVILHCGDVDCEDTCPVSPLDCPETVEVPGCGPYRMIVAF